MSKLILGAAAALILTASAAQAQEQQENLFISPAGQPFTALKGEPFPIVLWFKGADKNADGKLDKAEHRADAEAFFAQLDRNKDGVISPPEVTIYERYFVPEILRIGALGGGLIRVQLGPDPIVPETANPEAITPRQRLNTNQGAVFFSLFREPEPVRAADRNLDYVVTLKEFGEHADRHFLVLDADGDGFVSLADLPQTQAEKQARAKRQ